MTHFCNQVPAVAEAFCNSTALFAPDLKEKGAERLSWIGEIAGHYYQQLPTFAEMKTYASNGVDAAINYFPTAKDKLSQAGEYIADTLSDPRTAEALACTALYVALCISIFQLGKELHKAVNEHNKPSTLTQPPIHFGPHSQPQTKPFSWELHVICFNPNCPHAAKTHGFVQHFEDFMISCATL